MKTAYIVSMPDGKLKEIRPGIHRVRHWWQDKRFPLLDIRRIRWVDLNINDLNPMTPRESKKVSKLPRGTFEEITE